MPSELAVLMPAFNAEKTIRRSVESLLRSTERFDLVIVDDGSRLPVTEVLGPLPDTVQVVRLQNNLGVVAARNAGLRRLLAERYEFIAMLDADDICHADRFAKQLAFLHANPKVALVGGWAQFVDENSGEVVYHFRPPCDPAEMRDALFLNNCTVHSSWMVRAPALRETGLYCERFPLGEDYELLRRLALRYDIANLPEFLIDYTVSMSGLSIRQRRRQLADRLRIQVEYFDPWRRNAWLGLARTMALFVVPRTLIAAYRAEQDFRFQPS